MQADVPRNPRAYELYLRGVSTPTSVEGLKRGTELLRQSIALDSAYAPAYSELGWQLCQIGSYVPGEEKQLSAAEKAYQKALSLNPVLLSAIADLSSLYTDMGKTEEAFDLAQRAVALNPNNAESHFFLGYVYRYVGLTDEAVREMERAVAIDPGNPRFRSIGLTYMYHHDYEKALKGFDLDAGSPYCIMNKGVIYSLMKDTASALANFERVVAMEPKSVIGLVGATIRAGLLGHEPEAKALLREMHRAPMVDGEQWYYLAGLDAALGETDLCAGSLRRAIDGGFFNYPYMISDPNLAPLRNDPAIVPLIGQAKSKRDAFLKRFGLNPDNN
jgi:tetratricopeptide (TPR) repeat protein